MFAECTTKKSVGNKIAYTILFQLMPFKDNIGKDYQKQILGNVNNIYASCCWK